MKKYYPCYGIVTEIKPNVFQTPDKLHNMICSAENHKKVGLRDLVTPEIAQKGLDTLNSSEKLKIDTQTWNRRYRKYTETIKSGEFLEMVIVYKSLLQLKNEKDLSFGERKMLDCVKNLIESEINEVLNTEMRTA